MEPLRALRYATRYANWRELASIRRSGGKPQSAVLRNGLRFEAPADTNVIRVTSGVFFKRHYTPPGFEIAENDVIVDVGANIGAFSVYAARRTRAKVVAIEPHPQNFRYLVRNLIANGCTRAKPIECAITAVDEPVRLCLGRSGSLHRLAALCPEPNVSEWIEVAGLSLPTLMERMSVDRIDLLKLDCEGAEGVILPSTPGPVLERVRRIVMEFHDDLSPVGHEEIRRLLEDSGFETRFQRERSDRNGLLYASRPRE
jgi:FkbM family methyltransferase